MVLQISGTRNGDPWPAPGGYIELSDSEAVQVIREHQAVPASDESRVEKAVLAQDVETRVEVPVEVPVEPVVVPTPAPVEPSKPMTTTDTPKSTTTRRPAK